MDIDITVYKQEFLELLRSCKRDGIDDVINDLEGLFRCARIGRTPPQCQGRTGVALTQHL